LNDLEKIIINICNEWKNSLDGVDESFSTTYSVSKTNLRNLWLKKTGEFLKLSAQIENQLFSHIVNNLSKKHDINDSIISEYLNWCFDHMDFLKQKYNEFSLSAIMKHAEQWDRNLFDVKLEEKSTLKDLKGIVVSKNIFHFCEKYGVCLVATKLQKETKAPIKQIEKVFISKLINLTNNTNDLMKLKRILMKTAENSPYSSEIIFSNYKESLKDLFEFFSGEQWH
jgi:hypothetical protein